MEYNPETIRKKLKQKREKKKRERERDGSSHRSGTAFQSQKFKALFSLIYELMLCIVQDFILISLC